MGARRFLALANRTPAYDGAMTAAMTVHQHKEQPAQRQTSSDEPQQVDVDAMNLIVPGLIERVEV